MFPPNAYIFVQDTSKWSDVKPIRVRDVPLITCPLLIRRNKTRDKCKGTEERDESWTCVLPLEKIHHNFRDAHPQRNDICDIGWFWFRQNPFSPVSWTLSCPPPPPGHLSKPSPPLTPPPPPPAGTSVSTRVRSRWKQSAEGWGRKNFDNASRSIGNLGSGLIRI